MIRCSLSLGVSSSFQTQKNPQKVVFLCGGLCEQSSFPPGLYSGPVARDMCSNKKEQEIVDVQVDILTDREIVFNHAAR